MTVRSPMSKVQSPKTARLRPSRFGSWTLDFGLWTLPFAASLSSFAAATNAAAPDEIPKLRPPHSEIPPGFWEQYGLWIMLLGGVLLVMAGIAVWLLTRPKPPVVVPPQVRARQTLELLRHRPEDGVLLSRVSQILHQYLIAAFHLPPGERTTAEFSREIADHPRIGSELAANLGQFLRMCDQDKFSPPKPVPPLGAVARALGLIDQAEARRPVGQPTQSSSAAP
jgi:hypothetical protein